MQGCGRFRRIIDGINPRKKRKESTVRPIVSYETGKRTEVLSMTDSTQALLFPSLAGKEVVGKFDGGDITSDAGLLLLQMADEKIGMIGRMASALTDRRQPGKVAYSLASLLTERVFAIACGYEDANDLNYLRSDPGLKLACDRLPGGGDLAGQSTLSRFENRVTRKDLLRLATKLAEAVVAQLPSDAVRIVLDVDASEDPCHGQQEFEFFNRYYDSHCYLPLYLHVTAVRKNGGADRQRLLSVLLRPGKASATQGLFGLLRRAIESLRVRFGATPIVLRADGGFGQAATVRFCDKMGVGFVLGLPGNRRLHALSTPVQMDACLKYTFDKNGWAGERVCREWGEFQYKAATWEKKRRVVVKAEITQGELNPRFVVTSFAEEAPELVYAFYCERGDQENRIKESKLDLAAGRTSCHRFLANQFRVLLHAAAAVLMAAVQDALAGTKYCQAQIATVRLRLFKVAARIKETCRKVWVQLPSSYPDQDVWRALHDRLRRLATVT
jgi:hypothetical protein